MYNFEPELTKENVFTKITQEQVFEKYLGIKVQTKTHFVNPLRNDKRVTCKFKYYGYDLIFTDFSGWFSGDCVKFVMFLFGCNYYEALSKIVEDVEVTGLNYVYNTTKTNKNKKSKISFTKRNFNIYDANYWKNYSISSKTLKFFNVFAIQTLTVNDKIGYIYNYKDPAYLYLFDNDNIKVYFPFRKQFRFLSNTNCIQGYNNLPKQGEILVITKSYKDVMVLYELELYSISFQNEIVIPDIQIIEELKQRFKKVYLFYDFDLTGVRTSNKIRKQFDIKPLFLTNGKFNTVDYKAKDISDYIKLYGKESTIKLINYALLKI